MQKEVIVVTGLARCGSSLMMQMLEAGGVPVVHDDDRVSYECEDAQMALVDGSADFLSLLEPGHAVKLLDPHRTKLPGIRIAFIWMSRRCDHQGKSQTKFLSAMMSVACDHRRYRSFEESIRHDNANVPFKLDQHPSYRVLVVHFEELIEMPLITSQIVRDFLQRELDVFAMEHCVIERSPDCAPDMQIEIDRLKLIEANNKATGV